jgi:hypothetical protein
VEGNELRECERLLSPACCSRLKVANNLVFKRVFGHGFDMIVASTRRTGSNYDPWEDFTDVCAFSRQPRGSSRGCVPDNCVFCSSRRQQAI